MADFCEDTNAYLLPVSTLRGRGMGRVEVCDITAEQSLYGPDAHDGQPGYNPQTTRLGDIHEYLTLGTRPFHMNKSQFKTLKKTCRRYRVVCGILQVKAPQRGQGPGYAQRKFTRPWLTVPQLHEVEPLLDALHRVHHNGHQRMAFEARGQWHIVDLDVQIRAAIRRCPREGEFQNLRDNRQTQPIYTRRPMEHVVFDFTKIDANYLPVDVGKFTRSGHSVDTLHIIFTQTTIQISMHLPSTGQPVYICKTLITQHWVSKQPVCICKTLFTQHWVTIQIRSQY